MNATPSFRRVVAMLLAATGAACLIWSSVMVFQGWRFGREQREALARVRQAPVAETSPDAVPAMDAATVALHGLVGILDIPRLGLSEVVAEGDDDESLNIAVGHLPDTPLPWLLGNSALAAHRDTRFQALRNIRIGDRLSLATPHGDFVYAVRRFLIVQPDDISVLVPTEQRSLTLITCYPFIYIGHAPRRFIVQADEVTAFSDRP
jgi:sortase A